LIVPPHKIRRDGNLFQIVQTSRPPVARLRPGLSRQQKAARMPMMAMTTSSSISAKAHFLFPQNKTGLRGFVSDEFGLNFVIFYFSHGPESHNVHNSGRNLPGRD
jgi:hypothetical protein